MKRIVISVRRSDGTTPSRKEVEGVFLSLHSEGAGDDGDSGYRENGDGLTWCYKVEVVPDE